MKKQKYTAEDASLIISGSNTSAKIDIPQSFKELAHLLNPQIFKFLMDRNASIVSDDITISAVSETNFSHPHSKSKKTMNRSNPSKIVITKTFR